MLLGEVTYTPSLYIDGVALYWAIVSLMIIVIIGMVACIGWLRSDQEKKSILRRYNRNLDKVDELTQKNDCLSSKLSFTMQRNIELHQQLNEVQKNG